MPWDSPHKRILIESDEPESEVFFYEAQTLHKHSTSIIQWRRVLVSTLSHRAGHSEVKRVRWPDETAALQLFAHLKGEALNVALLLTKEKRESWTGLVNGLAAYYQSPSRLADLRRRFKSAFRQPGLDPATFATDLGILAIQGFEDMKKQARDTMIRDKFIAGQEQ